MASPPSTSYYSSAGSATARDLNWLEQCQAANRSCDEIMADLTELIRMKRANVNTSQASAALRVKQTNLNTSLNALESSLHSSHQSGQITEKELQRRQDLLNNLRQRKDQLNALMKKASSISGAVDTEKDSLLSTSQPSGSSKSKRVWGQVEESETTRLLDNAGVISYQHDLMTKQDESLEQLLYTVRKQKEISIAISDELDHQKGLLDDLTNAVENSENKLKKETKRIMTVSDKAKVGGSLCCIVILIVVAVLLVILL